MTTSGRPSPVRVRDVLTAALPGLGDRFLEERIRASWADVAGPIARRSRPEWLRAGTLDVRVDNSATLHEARLRSAQLLTALQQRFGPGVAALKLLLGALPAAAPPPHPPRRRGPAPRLRPEEYRLVEGLVPALADPDLARALRRLVSRDLLARRERDAGVLVPLEKETP